MTNIREEKKEIKKHIILFNNIQFSAILQTRFVKVESFAKINCSTISLDNLILK